MVNEEEILFNIAKVRLALFHWYWGGCPLSVINRGNIFST
jgi:hypothetical protein